ncbi:MAG: esterase/lipase family protein [Verrucomicrobiales bacterium]
MNFSKYLSFLLALSVLPAAKGAAAAITKTDFVCHEGNGPYLVLVHGLSWFRDSNKIATDFFCKAGYHVIAVQYDSRKIADASDAVAVLRRVVAQTCVDRTRLINFLGHSLGAIVIRQYLAETPPPRLGRVVLMGCPNQGTALANALPRLPALKRVFGGAAAQLGTHEGSLPNTLGPAPYRPGIIMGGRSMFPFLSPFVPGRDDGVVGVESGRLKGMGDFLVLPTTHTYLPRCEVAIVEADSFFKTGKFLPWPPR